MYRFVRAHHQRALSPATAVGGEDGRNDLTGQLTLPPAFPSIPAGIFAATSTESDPPIPAENCRAIGNAVGGLLNPHFA